VTLTTALAHAEKSTIVLVDGQVLVGDVTEVVSGDHLVIHLGSGETKAVAWLQIRSLQIGAGATIVIAPAGPSPRTTSTTDATPTPPPVPAPTADGAGTIAPPIVAFSPRFSLGARLTSLTPGGNVYGTSVTKGGVTVVDGPKMTDYVRSGIGIEGDLGYHFTPSWTVYAFWELGLLAKSDLVNASSDTSTTNLVGVGINVDTAPRGPLGFYADAAIGGRWMTVSAPNGDGTFRRETYTGFEALRLSLGIAVAIGRNARLLVAPTISIGSFTHSSGPGCSDGSACTSIDESKRAWHTFGGLTIGGRFDL